MFISEINIELDKSVAKNKFFNKLLTLKIDKSSLFKYAIFNITPPSFIHENDFEYFESKIPSMAEFYGDYISFEKNRIINYAPGETMKNLSEIIGVGIGLQYSVELLKINPNLIKKTPKPDNDDKYMDFRVNSGRKTFEIETKGTTVHTPSNINKLLNDIYSKKEDSEESAIKFGVITLANKEDNLDDSKIVVCDDFTDKDNNKQNSIKDYYEYYSVFLSFTLDSTYYNRLMEKVIENKFTYNMINKTKFRGEYLFDGRKFIGEYFDERLILQKISENYFEGITLNQLFGKLTEKEGIVKYFVGIDYRIIKAFNKLDIEKLKEYSNERKVTENENFSIVCDTDGVIFVKSINNYDEQIKDKFNEEEVKRRLGLMLNYYLHEPHECGAPCTSYDKEGKPCEILTYRDNCHFHR